MVYRQDFFFEKKKQKTFIFFRRLHFAGPTLETAILILTFPVSEMSGERTEG
jgi:hypothetical protein